MARFGRTSRARAAAALLAVALSAPLAAAATTATFGGKGDYSYPGTMAIRGGVVTVDLSAVGKAEVYRAVFLPKREVFRGHDKRALAACVVTSAGGPLELLGPRYRSFDATKCVRAAVKAAKPLTIKVESLPGWDGRTARLEVTFAGKTAGKLPVVTALTARHREGQTILTFREVDPPTVPAKPSNAEIRAVNKKLAAAPRIVYRIYRWAAPITPATIGKAALVDQIAPLTCWNAEYHGVYAQGKPARRYVVADGGKPVDHGTAIYAHNPAKAGRAYYAVTVAVAGREDLDRLGEGNTVGPVTEVVGPGPMVLQRIEKPEAWNYHRKPTLRYYVRWESPPRCNVPSRPFDYVVAIPGDVKWPAPVYIAFHCWGASLNSGYGWWYRRPPRSSLLIATNQIPYDWWTGYHEAMGTWRPWSRGMVRSYTFKRIDALYAWVARHYKIDPTRTHAGGNSMGGAGSLVYASHRADKISWVSSWVGVHVPAKTPHFLGSYELCYGRLAWKLRHESGQTAFDHFDDAAWIREHPAMDIGLMAFGNGKLDGGIGWPQAVEYFRALQRARQPHVFTWALSGHDVRATLPGPAATGSTLKLDIRLDQSLPALTRCSLDGDPGTGKRLATPKPHKMRDGKVRKDAYDGDPNGHANRWLYWLTGDVVDQPTRWEMTLALMSKSPKDDCTVDVTPRRLQQLRPKPGEVFSWTNEGLADGKVIQTGQAKADKWALVTLENVKVTKGKNRIHVVRR